MAKKIEYPEWLDEIETTLDNRVILYLQEHDKRYGRAVRNRRKIMEEYPLFNRLEDGEGGITLSPEQHKAYREYLVAKSDVEALERKGYYIMGQAEASYYGQVARDSFKNIQKRVKKGRIEASVMPDEKDMKVLFELISLFQDKKYMTEIEIYLKGIRDGHRFMESIGLL